MKEPEEKSKAITKKKDPPLVAQPHGGAIFRGGVPGNKGGGRRPNHIREEIRSITDDRVLKEIKRRLGPKNIRKLADKDLVSYFRELATFGLGHKHEHSGPDDGPISHGVLLIPGVPVGEDEEPPA